MKNIAKASLWLLLTGLMMLAAASCGTQKKDQFDQQTLVVERQNVQLTSHHDGYYEGAFAVDIPVSGPRPLRDSLKVFLNQQLHEAFESSLETSLDFDSLHFTANELFHDKLSDMLPYYEEKYLPFADELFNPMSFSLLLISQTDQFVTYGLEYYACGGSCGSSFHCFTFSKKDGQKIGNLISWNDILRFINDHPEAEHPFGQWQLESNDTSWFRELFDAGLTEEGLLVINEDQMNHYVAGLLQYEDVLPYLSKEAQDIVGSIGKTTKYSRDDWYLGKCIGEVKNTRDETIFLMQQESLWEGFADFQSVFPYESTIRLRAYSKKDGRYVMKKVLPTAKMEFKFPDVAWSGPSTFDDGDYFIFDSESDLLFVPYLKERSAAEYAPYRFNGRRFVRVSDKAYQVPPYKEIAKLVDESGYIEKDDIHLLADHWDNGCWIGAYIVRDGLYIPKKVFPGQECAIKNCWDELITTNPEGVGYAFNPEDQTLYLAVMEHLMMGYNPTGDLFHKYQFNGKCFVEMGEEGGFWLHPSIRDFGHLVFVRQSEDELIRVDELRIYDDRYDDQLEASLMDTCRFRYAAWRHKDNMLDEPDVVINNGWYDSNSEAFVFESDGYRYVAGDDLKVYHGNILVLKEKLLPDGS